jgi:hypothetical protein
MTIKKGIFELLEHRLEALKTFVVRLKEVLDWLRLLLIQSECLQACIEPLG